MLTIMPSFSTMLCQYVFLALLRCPETDVPWVPNEGKEVTFMDPIINKLKFEMKAKGKKKAAPTPTKKTT